MFAWSQRPSLRSLVIASAVVLWSLIAVRAAKADVVFNVSGTFADTASTPLTGTIHLDAATQDITDFSFVIPTMINGVTTLPGATFNPSTATLSFNNVGPHAFAINFQLIGGSPQGETLFLIIPAPVPNPYTGGPLLREVVVGGQAFHSGYQSGVQANPFFMLKSDGVIAPAVPEPATSAFVAMGVAAILIKRRGIRS